MNSEQRRDQLIEAVESEPSDENLDRAIKDLLSKGIEPFTLLEDLDEIRGLLSEEKEDLALSAMDRFVGWCGAGQGYLNQKDMFELLQKWNSHFS